MVSPVYIVRNNTFIIGESAYTADAYPSYAFGERPTSNNGTVTVSFDNNNVYDYSEVLDGGSYGLHRGNNSTFTINSLKNNNFFQLDALYYGNSGADNYTDAITLNGSIANADANISEDIVNSSNTYFVDETSDWHLVPGSGSSVLAGGIDGATAAWSFTDDINAVTRTGNGSTGWSMGAYEQD